MYKYVVALVLMLCGVAFAQSPSLQVGTNTTGVSWAYDKMYERGSLTGVPEVGIIQWQAYGVTSNQAYIAPALRYELSPSWYVTGGIGLSYFNRTTFGEKTISTHFQFIDRIGVMYRTRDFDVGVQYVHASNAGIKRPNPGMDTVQFVFSVPFN